MTIRDQAFDGALALAEGLEETGLSSGPIATDAGCDWRSRYDRERERADAAEELASRVGALEARIGELEGENDRLRSSRAGLSKSMFGRKSEQQGRESSGRKRGRQRGAPGHGRTQRPGLAEKKERHDPPEEVRACPRCGEPCTANGTEESSILEIEVKARKRRIVRSRWRRVCTCPSPPTEAIAEPVPRPAPAEPGRGLDVRPRTCNERGDAGQRHQAGKQRKLDKLEEEGSGIREKCKQWWGGLGPDERVDEEAKAIEACKEDEHLKEQLGGGYGQSMAQKFAKG